ncbi:MAG: RluA family pseudouridine synthase [Oscillospiraceae bacterium]|jgi:23S rRNA pseudouridine1911/1915/1917 synthase|nr:RluA family pseudouridine synthase [Oscillospiraceae bacterium]
MGEAFSVTLPEDYDGARLDKTLAELLRRSRAFVQGMIEGGQVLLNGAPAKKSNLLREGDELACAFAQPTALAARPEAIPLDVRYEDADLLVVNKPQGMVVHPAPGHAGHTLVNALLYHCAGQLSGINGVLRPGIVHRIDKDTGGLLIVAKNDFAHAALAEQIAAHSFTREYRAVVHGMMKQSEGAVDAPIGRSERDRKKMAVTLKNSKPARTRYSLVSQYERFADLSLRLETGRTHQIRVHMAHIAHPVAGDPLYGPQPPVKGLQGQCLHARLIGFVHPRTGEYLEIEAELPAYYTSFLDKI